ncbi:MAG: FAD-dependent oxidoreductase, partial [Pikeienuella sp.]
DARPKGGGLNEYGIAAYKTVNEFASKELNWLLSIGGIELKTGLRLGDNLALDTLQDSHDAVVLAMGLSGVNAMGCPGEDAGHVQDAVDFIARVRQDDHCDIPVGRNVVVVGGGMTAIDAAVQAKFLGAETVTIAYRRSRGAMGASPFEQNLATSKGVTIREHLQPMDISADNIALGFTRQGEGGLELTGETAVLHADQVLVAVGQSLNLPVALTMDGRKIAVDEGGHTSLTGVWAAGDCTNGEDLTVVAVAEGRDVAENIHSTLSAAKAEG